MRTMRIEENRDNEENDNSEDFKDNEDNDIEKTPWMNDPIQGICGMWETDYISGNWEQQYHHS